MEIRPLAVSREQTVARVKWDSGEVCCHQQVGPKSASARSRSSSRYCGCPSLMTSISPARASATLQSRAPAAVPARFPGHWAAAGLGEPEPPAGSSCCPRSPKHSGNSL